MRVKLLWPKEKRESCHPVLAGADPKTLLQPVCVCVRASVCVCVSGGERSKWILLQPSSYAGDAPMLEQEEVRIPGQRGSKLG